ncbi:MAG: UDP-N-acetylglucosamine 4,6-dehydratase [endosymbiont of Galathealinum brachiosum]|uniref:UDP-N-acetylglucosamine 4,6-dehydratase n=1 Tax=endosymbiont of Galathealinum brachiosum TaxID=2200906 RepID=A0A370DB72_9GAMM|nr:MAG: UDP-N-acetylglucosamine 4,6-dehydratase [endosymbiont of Galathealinum brachiosum]
MSQILSLIGREKELFNEDIEKYDSELKKIISSSTFLVVGGAGSIGQAVVKEIFKRNPKKLHVVDISENNMVELVRDLRSSIGYIEGEFQTLALDIGSIEYDAFIESDGKYDYVFNLSALKHVRSEKDPFTLMRMIDVNVFNTDKTIQQSIDNGAKKYFCVSTDKAANPANMMGASKKIMEMFLMRKSLNIEISTARFANVAFSDGSLLHSFNQRIEKNQPIVAPKDIKRYFITQQESGELCLMSCLFGENRDIFFPKLSKNLHLMSFADIAVEYLKGKGYEPYLCEDEDEARTLAKTLPKKGMWPCFFTISDTTGEKDFEEFFTDKETIDMEKYQNIAVIKNDLEYEQKLLENFEETIRVFKENKQWSKKDIVDLFFKMIPEFGYKDTGKYLDGKM